MPEELKMRYVPTGALKPHPLNPRHHPPSQLRQVAKSIQVCGFINPIIIDADATIVAGHARLLAAQQLGLKMIPVIEVTHLSEAQLRAYMLADNKLVENAGWDKELLRVHLDFLTQIDLDFDIDMTGFSTPEIDLLFQKVEQADAADAEIPDPPAPADAVTQPGDLWLLDEHRILCGDVRSPADVHDLMADQAAAMVFTDPPYNVPINGHVSGLGKHRHPEFAMASGEMSAREFCGFLTASFAALAVVSRDGAVHFLCMDWRHLAELLAAAAPVYDTQLNLCIWTKTNAGMGSLYRSQHELIGVYRVGKSPHTNNVELGKHGRYRTNVWQYAGMNAFGSEREEALSLHPTVKPVRLIVDAILDVTHRKDIVLDGFLGSGSTLLAAERTGRIGYGIEIEPRYVDVAVRRWQAMTGRAARHAQTGTAFDELAMARRARQTGEH